MTTVSELSWAAFAAIDWANQKNFWRLVPADSRQHEQGELENTRKRWRCGRLAWDSVLVADPWPYVWSSHGGALVYMLSKYPHLVLFPVHPTTAASTWAACGSGLTNNVWTSPRTVLSTSITMNGSSTAFPAGTQLYP
jgi:hypothetical protein